MYEILQAASDGRYAVGAFNFTALVDLQAAVQAAEEERSPLILQIHPAGIDTMGLPYVMASVQAALDARVPITLHLDHGRDLADVETCVRAGFASVMIDGSSLPLADNVALTARAVEIAHASGVFVEAELGRVGSGEEEVDDADRARFMTDPGEAAVFVEKTGVDSLAVAIGSAHGLYRFEPELDFRRLQEIRSSLSVPLVLHGGSDLPEDQIRRAINLGISKINVHTDSVRAYDHAVRAAVSASDELIWPSHLLAAGRSAVKELVGSRMRLFGSSGRAG